MLLETGAPAPDFALEDKEGNTVKLSDFRGKKVVLYFYPKDNTPGCSRQACAFAAAYEGFKAKNVVVIGVSRDSAASHRKFAEKYGLRCLAGEEALRQGEHGRGAHHLPHRRERADRKGDAQGQARHQRRRDPGIPGLRKEG